MIAVVAASTGRIGYALNDVVVAGIDRAKVPLIAADPMCGKEAQGSGVFDVYFVDRNPDALRRSAFRLALGSLERRVSLSSGSASYRFVRSLEWRLRVFGRLGRLAEPFQNRRFAQRFPQRLADRLGEVRVGYPAITEVWVYDAWILPQVVDVFGETARIVVR